MNILKVLIASGLISVSSHGVKRVYAESIRVPEGTEIVNMGQFLYDLNVPLDSLDTKVDGQEYEIRRAEANGDTIGLMGLRERTREDSERKSRLGGAVKSIEDSTSGKVANYNSAIGDGVLTTEEKNLLTEIDLDPNATEEYCNIVGGNYYRKIDGAIGAYNQNVLDLRILAGEDPIEVPLEELIEIEAEESEEEHDYTKMDRRGIDFGAIYGNDMVGGFARAMYNLNDKHKLGAGIEYAEQVGEDKNTLSTQRNPITGARLEASETKDRSRLEAGLEWSYNIRSPFSLRAILGGGRKTLDNTIVEKLYDKKNNLFGPGNKDNFDNRDWYWKFLPGVSVESGNVSVEGYAGVIKYSTDKKAEIRARVGYRF